MCSLSGYSIKFLYNFLLLGGKHNHRTGSFCHFLDFSFRNTFFLLCAHHLHIHNLSAVFLHRKVHTFSASFRCKWWYIIISNRQHTCFQRLRIIYCPSFALSLHTKTRFTCLCNQFNLFSPTIIFSFYLQATTYNNTRILWGNIKMERSSNRNDANHIIHSTTS